MFLGIAIGLLVGIVINFFVMYSYMNILVMKANDGTAEYIHGKFYYIKEEGKSNE